MSPTVQENTWTKPSSSKRRHKHKACDSSRDEAAGGRSEPSAKPIMGALSHSGKRELGVDGVRAAWECVSRQASRAGCSLAVLWLSVLPFPPSPCPTCPQRQLALTLSQMAEKAMTPHSSTLAWKIPWTEEPGRLQSMGSRRVGHD